MDADLLWLLPAGFAAGIVNTLAGGGSFLTLSALIWLGLPGPVANATNRVGVLAQTLTATEGFRRAGALHSDELWPQLAVVTLGAALGAVVSVWLDPALFEKVLGVCMVVMLAVTLRRPDAWTTPGPPRSTRWPALFGAGLYGGFLQAGVGVLLLPALVLLGGQDLVRANARKMVLVMVFTLPALAIYVANDLVHWLPGAVLAAGSATGGWVGTRLTINAGARAIWAVLVGVVAITALRLLLT